MQPTIVFFFFGSIISMKDDSFSLDLLRVRSFLDLYLKFLSIYSNPHEKINRCLTDIN